MSSTFSEYVRSSAFNLSLSENMIRFLLVEYFYETEIKGTDQDEEFWTVNRTGSHFITAAHGLQRRGLVYHKSKETHPEIPREEWGHYITEPGFKMCEILLLAGYSLGKNPDSISKGIEVAI